MSGADDTAEGNQSLWFVVAAPLVWAGHFIASYFTAAVWCERYAGPDASLGGARVAIGVYTVLALAAIGLVAAFAWRRYRQGDDRLDADTAMGRHRFVGSATLLLAALSALATVYSALAAVFVGSCH